MGRGRGLGSPLVAACVVQSPVHDLLALRAQASVPSNDLESKLLVSPLWVGDVHDKNPIKAAMDWDADAEKLPPTRRVVLHPMAQVCEHLRQVCSAREIPSSGLNH